MVKGEHLAMFEKAQEELRQDRARESELSKLPMETLAGAAIAAMVKPELNWFGAPRQPASRQALETAQDFLGVQLPRELKAFYLLHNGFEGQSPEFPYSLLPAEELRRGHQCKPPLSRWLQARAAASPGGMRPNSVAVFAHDDIEALAMGAELFTLSLEALGSLVVIESSASHRRVCFSPEGIGSYPPGAILEIEETTACIFEGFKVWLASVIVNFELPGPGQLT